MQTTLEARRQQVLYDTKWKRFRRRSRLFRHIPFVEIVLGAGSMALGNVRANSDFDVIVGTRRGRIFTARFFSILAFGALGWRRPKLTHEESAADKICLNHFVTEESFTLSPPYDDSWRALYQHLVPLFGSPASIARFLGANEQWVGLPLAYRHDLRHEFRQKSAAGAFGEWILGGRLGTMIESALKTLQVRRIERGLRRETQAFEPRIRYTDNELEFHPDTRRRYRND